MKCKKVLAALTAAAVVSGVPMISALAKPQTITEYDFDKSTPEGHKYDVKENNVNKDYGNSAWLKEAENNNGANQLNVNVPSAAGYKSAVFSFEAGRAKSTGALRLVLVGSDNTAYNIVQIDSGGGSLLKFDISPDNTIKSPVVSDKVYANVGYMHKITCVVTGNKFDVYIGKGADKAITGAYRDLTSNEAYGYELYSGTLPDGVNVKTFRLQEWPGGNESWKWMIDNVSLTADYGSDDEINTLDKLKSAIESGQGEITIPDNTKLSIAAGPDAASQTALRLNANQRIIVPEGSSIVGYGHIYAPEGSAVVYKKTENDKSVDYSFTGILTYNKDASKPQPINNNTMYVSSDGMTGFIRCVKENFGDIKTVTIKTSDKGTLNLSLEERFPTVTGDSSVVFGLIITDAGNTKITSVTVK